MKFAIDDEGRDLIVKQKIVEGPDSLHRVSNQRIPKLIADQIERMIKLDSIYLMGLMHEGQLLGEMMIFLGKDGTLDSSNTVETVVNLVANALQKQIMAESLRQSEEHFRSLVENPVDYAIYRTKENRTSYPQEGILVSPSIARIVGMKTENLHNIEAWFENVHHDDLDRLREAIRRGYEPPYEFSEVLRIIHPDRGLRWIEVKSKGIVGEKGRLTYANGIIIDITDRKNAEEALKTSLEEKDTLLRELYHRTKNNMQVISGMIQLRDMQVEDNYLHSIFEDVIARIRSMALVHEKLYQSKNLSRIDLDDYIMDLANLLRESRSIDPENIRIDLDIESVETAIDIAIPLGLVMSELITNSFKHAFPNHGKGRITIAVERYDHSIIRVLYKDNGVGLPDGFDIDKTESLGITTIKSLILHQLKGDIQFENKQGLTCIIEIDESVYQPTI
jgi:PAS domain S-box-containing protein